MRVVCLHSKFEIETVLRRNPGLNLYSLGDLDDFFWGSTTWYGLEREGRIEQLALVYASPGIPTLLAFTDAPDGAMAELLRSLHPLLPVRLHAHLSSGLPEVLGQTYRVESDGSFHKMALVEPARLAQVDGTGVERLTRSDLPELEALYRQSYPGNWFDPRMLETGFYFGLRREGVLACVAGIHVFSRQYRVAALGNITTHPAHRNRGLASRATAALCRALLAEVEHLGLNVSVDNPAAIACYERLGFQRIGRFEQCTLTLDPARAGLQVGAGPG